MSYGSSVGTGATLGSVVPGVGTAVGAAGGLLFELGKSIFGGIGKRKAAQRKAKDEMAVRKYRQNTSVKNRNIGQSFLGMLQRGLRNTRAAQGRKPTANFFGDDFEEKFMPGGKTDWSNWEAEALPEISTPGLFETLASGAAEGVGNYFSNSNAAEEEARRRILGAGQPTATTTAVPTAAARNGSRGSSSAAFGDFWLE